MVTHRIRLRHAGAAIALFTTFALLAPLAAQAAPVPCVCSITEDIISGPPGSAVTLTGAGFVAGGRVRVRFIDSGGVRTTVAKAKTVPVASDGTFSIAVTIPDPSAGGMGRFVAGERAYDLRAKVQFSVDQIFG
jgi:hypothetical protein